MLSPQPGGRITAGHSSGVVDGASTVLLGSSDKGRTLGLTPRARIAGMDVCGSDPGLMLTGPIDATHRLLDKTGVKLEDVALAEVNEAFASAAQGAMRGVLAYTDEPLVSSDFNGNPASSIVDAQSTSVMANSMVKTMETKWRVAGREHLELHFQNRNRRT